MPRRAVHARHPAPPPALRRARRWIAAVVGLTLLAFGALLLLLPGPGLLVIAVGFAVLASEFEWARRWLRRVRQRLESPTGR